MTTVTRFAIAAGILFIATTQPAFAYIDPAAGTFILQILAAAALGVTFYFRRVVTYVKRIFGVSTPERPTEDTQASDAESTK